MTNTHGPPPNGPLLRKSAYYGNFAKARCDVVTVFCGLLPLHVTIEATLFLVVYDKECNASMEWIVVSLAIVIAAGGTAAVVLYFVRRWYFVWLQERLLQEKQMRVYEEISELIGNVKATLEYTTGEETLGEWRGALMVPLREMLYKSYEWAVFLPEPLQELPSQYAGKVARSVARFNTLPSGELDTYAEIIDEIKGIERQAAADLQQQIRKAVGISGLR